MVGGTSAMATFKVFDCGGAFDVMLGKPWLHEVCATHNYFTDTDTIRTGLKKEELTNEEPTMDTIVEQISTSAESKTKPEPNKDTPTQPSPKHLSCTWVPQMKYEADKWNHTLAAAQATEEHQTLIVAARTRANRARKAETTDKAINGNEPCDDELEAEWACIHLLQISDSPWAETKWETFLGLTATRKLDPSWTQ